MPSLGKVVPLTGLPFSPLPDEHREWTIIWNNDQLCLWGQHARNPLDEYKNVKQMLAQIENVFSWPAHPTCHRESRISLLEGTLKEFQQRLESLEQQVSILTNTENDEIIEPIPEVEWIEKHQTELDKYTGMHVAVNADRGIVAFSKRLLTVSRKVEKLGLSGKVLFHFVEEY